MNMIDRLQKNEKPYGLMDKDMQEAAKEIGVGVFDFLLGNCGGRWSKDEIDDMFRYYRTYQLRADYEPEKPEPEVVDISEDFDSIMESPHFVIAARFEEGTLKVGYKVSAVALNTICGVLEQIESSKEVKGK